MLVKLVDRTIMEAAVPGWDRNLERLFPDFIRKFAGQETDPFEIAEALFKVLERESDHFDIVGDLIQRIIEDPQGQNEVMKDFNLILMYRNYV